MTTPSPSSVLGDAQAAADRITRIGHVMIREGLTYGAGAMAAASRGDRLIWALHRAALTAGVIPVMPAVALAEGWRQGAEGVDDGSSRCEWFAAGIETEPLTAPLARLLGELGALAGVPDQVTVAVAEVAARRRHAVVIGRSSALADVATALGHDVVAHVI